METKRGLCLVGAAAAMMAMGSSCAKLEPILPVDPAVVNVGILLPLTGDLAASASNESAAVDLAIADANEHLGNRLSFNFFKLAAKKVDTGGDPDKALASVEKLVGEGVHVFVGPGTSEEVFRVLPWANSFDALLLSHASTCPSLAMAGDNLFRLVPDDRQQGQAIARRIWDNGGRVLVPIWRDDQYGIELLTAVKAHFILLGGTVLKSLRFEPGKVDAPKLTEQLTTEVVAAAEKYGASRVAVMLIAFDAGRDILAAAAAHEPLGSVPWYGSEGLALSDDLITGPAGAFAAKVGLTCGHYSPRGPRATQTAARIEKITGRHPDAYSLAAYDAVWLAAEAFAAAGSGASCAALRFKLMTVCTGVDGVTGPLILNDAGDRRDGPYAFWQVRSVSGRSRWEAAGRQR